MDTVCIAVGLTPSVELLKIAGCKFIHVPKLGGFVPLHNENMQSTNPSIYVAGDVAGIEEASTAMDEGRLAGISISTSLSLLDKKANQMIHDINVRYRNWAGPHGKRRKTKE